MCMGSSIESEENILLGLLAIGGRDILIERRHFGTDKVVVVVYD